jgi:hypothetical protein
MVEVILWIGAHIVVLVCLCIAVARDADNLARAYMGLLLGLSGVALGRLFFAAFFLDNLAAQVTLCVLYLVAQCAVLHRVVTTQR